MQNYKSSIIKSNGSSPVNAVVYIDYENISIRIKESTGSHIIHDLDFFRELNKYLSANKINVLSMNAYGNIEDSNIKKSDVALLSDHGVVFKHTANASKSACDMILAIDCMKDLYKNQYIDLFIIVSSDRDYIPLMNTIKQENKLVANFSTKTGYNEIVKTFSTYHEYIENICKQKLNEFVESKKIDAESTIKSTQANVKPILPKYNDREIKLAKTVAELFYSSNFYLKYKNEGSEKVGLPGFCKSISKNVMRELSSFEVEKYIKIASNLNFLSIEVNSENNHRYILDGDNTSELYIISTEKSN